MTPKEKSKKLIEIFYHKIHNTNLSDWLIMEKAKQCAIACVNEIISAMEGILGSSNDR